MSHWVCCLKTFTWDLLFQRSFPMKEMMQSSWCTLPQKQKNSFLMQLHKLHYVDALCVCGHKETLPEGNAAYYLQLVWFSFVRCIKISVCRWKATHLHYVNYPHAVHQDWLATANLHNLCFLFNPQRPNRSPPTHTQKKACTMYREENESLHLHIPIGPQKESIGVHGLQRT